MSKQSVFAVDLGATSGRVVLATFAEGRVSLNEVHRFSTAARQTDAGLRLDVVALFDEIQAGIGRAMEAAPDGVAALGIDWPHARPGTDLRGGAVLPRRPAGRAVQHR